MLTVPHSVGFGLHCSEWIACTRAVGKFCSELMPYIRAVGQSSVTRWNRWLLLPVQSIALMDLNSYLEAIHNDPIDDFFGVACSLDSGVSNDSFLCRLATIQDCWSPIANDFNLHISYAMGNLFRERHTQPKDGPVILHEVHGRSLDFFTELAMDQL